jgi:3-oxoacyl-[acyl-carrier-protein] synthase III
MKLRFENKRVSGMLCVLPANERSFLEEMANYDFPKKRSLKLKEVMGYDKHRIVKDGVCSSDLAVAGLERLFEKGLLERDGFDALLVVTQTPDFFLPATSNVIQGRLQLKQDMLCLDINQGCAGFVLGLMQAFLLLEQASIRKVVLINVDVLSRKVSPKDRNSYPLSGDGASITILENDPQGGVIHANLQMDGSRNDALIIPAGGMRLPSTPETAVQEEAGEGNYRSKDNLRMDGTAVFNFVQTEVPPMIEALFAEAGVCDENIDYYLFHQPNRFMLQKLAEKMEIDFEKMPSNVVEHFGNSTGVTIPAATTFNLGDTLENASYNVCFAGFGVGLTWASMLMTLGPLDFCEMMNFE